jgi:hypothetical protein
MTAMNRSQRRGATRPAWRGLVAALLTAAALAAPSPAAATPPAATTEGVGEAFAENPAPASLAAAVTEAPRPLALTEIRPGMTGYGLSVFEGSRIDTFGVRVLGTQTGARADGSIIMVELSGPPVESAAVAQGMSGSPVFLEGRFAGAVAFGWAGALRPIAGLTPAAEILALPAGDGHATMEELGGEATVPGPAPDLRDLVRWTDGTRALARALLGDAAESVAPAPAGAGMEPPGDWPDPATLWHRLTAGFAPAAGRQPAAGALTPLPVGWIHTPLTGSVGGHVEGRAAGTVVGPKAGIAAGSAVGAATGFPLEAGTSGATPRVATLQPGAACAVALITGDAQLGALGTATWIDGDRVLMMGHPFLQRGPVALPLAAAEVITVFPSRQMSFKIGSVGPVLGTVLHDQRAGLVGRLGDPPPLVPVSVTIAAAGEERAYSFAVAHDTALTPALVFWCFYNALLVRGDDRSRQTLRYEFVSEWQTAQGEPLDPIVLEGQVVGPGGAGGLAQEWMAPLQILLANRHRPLRLERVTARVSASRPVSAATITDLSAPTTLRPGQEVRVGVTLESFRAADRVEEFSIRVPEHLAPGRYRLAAASARELFALEAQRAAALFRDRSLAATLDLIRTPRSASTLVVILISPAGSPVVAGRELESLPGSVRRALRPTAGGSAENTLASLVLRRERDTELALSGHATIDLTVRPVKLPTPEEDRP